MKARQFSFEESYRKLNGSQKDAVDSIDGPVMVVAGPGTGKTQIIALRIGNILLKTDTKPDGILCLTFTNSGVRAMRDRLEKYIGSDASKVHVSTFHSFGLELIEKHFDLLDFPAPPKLLDDDEAVFLVDEILRENEWEYLRPRGNPEMYFSDLKQLISVLKRERLKPAEFLSFVESDIENLKNAEDSVSTRGESKGKLKKEVEKKIESLSRTKEVVEFYRIYEERKREAGLLDYDDALEYTVTLAEDFEDVRADIYENFEYVLVDEHQDSSGVQNAFLKAVWKDAERPNIFVVGDDRQLIYGFSGAKLSYFEEFAQAFGSAKLVVLTVNYRSTENILSLADDLLKSSLAKEKLRSNLKGKTGEKIGLFEYAYPRDEIIGAGLYFKKTIDGGIAPEECALLVPKNHHVRSAIEILHNLGVPVSSGGNISLFGLLETRSFRRALGIISDPHDAVLISESLLDGSSGIEAFAAHQFLKASKPEELSIEKFIAHGGEGLFAEGDAISKWGQKLKNWINALSGEKLSAIIGTVGSELLIDGSREHDKLIRSVEVVRSFIHLADLFEKKNGDKKLSEFLQYLNRLESYGSHIGLSVFGQESGVKVMTLHKSKGLEYQAVWIAHLNEEVVMSDKKSSFALPEEVKMRVKERDIDSAKRELYVAITRAKEFCNISYAAENYGGGGMELCEIIRDLPESHFIKKNKDETEKEILENGPRVYAAKIPAKEKGELSILKKFVRENYPETKISVTMLNNFFECPWKWYFRNFLRLPEVKSASLALGSAVHKAIEFILKNKSASLPSDTGFIREKIMSALEQEGINSASELRKLAKDGEAAVKRFVNDFYANLSPNYAPERPLQFRDARFPYLLMYGKIDLTERRKNGDIIITDFKTGGSKTKNAIEKIDEEGRLSPHLRQLAMYSYLIAGTEKGKQVSESRLLYLESLKDDKNFLYSTRITDKQIDLLSRDIADYDSLLKSGEWVNRSCNHNSYGHAGGRASKNTVCEYCKMAEIYK